VAALADLFSYYVPTAVIALALWVVLRDRHPILALAALLGALGYVIAGSIGAAGLAMAGPTLIHHGTPEQKARSRPPSAFSPSSSSGRSGSSSTGSSSRRG
jgi:hypothetical protein